MKRIITMAACVAALCLAPPLRAADYPEIQVGQGHMSRYTPPVWANAMFQAPEWKDNASSTIIYPPQLGLDGCPLYLAAGQVLRAEPLIDSSATERRALCTGRVALTWEGEADMRLDASSMLVSGSVSGVVLNGRREYYAPGLSGNNLRTYVYGLNSNNPPHRIRLWLPDPADTNRSLAPPAGEEGNVARLIHPTYRETLAPFRLLRPMDWLKTNGNPQKNWAGRRPPLHYAMCGNLTPALGDPGVAYEMCVAVCNTNNADLWLCVPIRVDDDFVTNLARTILYGSDGTNPYTTTVANPVFPPLSTNLRVLVEYANEIWNFEWNYAQAQAISNGLSNPAQFTGLRASRIWHIFDQVFGAQSNRVVRVAAWQNGSASGYRDLINTAMTNGCKPHVISCAPYFGNSIESWVWNQGAAFFRNPTNDASLGKTFDEWMRRLLSGQVTGNALDNTTGGMPQAMRDLSLQYNLPLVNYEGGPSIYTSTIDNGVNPTGMWWTAFMCELNRRTPMTDLYRVQLNMCKARGMRTHSCYFDCGGYGKYGQWGHKEFLSQSADSNAANYAIKYRFILDWMEEQQRIRFIDDAIDAVPQFSTGYLLPAAQIGRTYTADILSGGGDGACTASVVGAFLAPGLTAGVAAGDAGRLRITGTATDEVSGAYCYLLARVLDGNGDPSWRKFEFRVFGGNGTIVESDFAGPDPALHRPWTNAFLLAPQFTFGGWNCGSGANAVAGTNVFAWVQTMAATPSSLDYALANNQYVMMALVPPPGVTMDLRGAQVQFTINRIDYHAPRQYAVFSSVAGFASNALLYSTPYFSDTSAMGFSCALPETAAYQAVSGATEFRIYGYGGQYASHKTSLIAAKLKAKYVTFNQQPIAMNCATTAPVGALVFIDALANCFDWNGDALGFQSVTQPAHGTSAIAGALLSYQSAPAFAGTDTFWFTISDSHGVTDSAMAIVLVLPEPVIIGYCLSTIAYWLLRKTDCGNPLCKRQE